MFWRKPQKFSAMMICTKCKRVFQGISRSKVQAEFNKHHCTSNTVSMTIKQVMHLMQRHKDVDIIWKHPLRLYELRAGHMKHPS